MSIQLAAPIAGYFEAANRGDAAALADLFTPGAIVRDEGQTYIGRAAIEGWSADTSKKYRPVSEQLAVAERDGRIVVTNRVSGNFPGSPIELTATFTLEGERISELAFG